MVDLSKYRYLNWGLWLLLLIVLHLVTMAVSLGVGDIAIKFADIPDILFQGEGMEYAVLTKLRIPRIVLGFAVGGALSLSGALLQGVYRNPLVEPYTLGISGGAALGVTIAIVFGMQMSIGAYMLPVFGFTGAVITIFLVYILSVQRRLGLNINKMLLIGIMISFIASSVMMFLMAITTKENLHSIVFWIMGSLNEPNTNLIWLTLIASIIGLGISYLYVNQLNALRLGESKAKHLGVNTASTVKVLFIVASFVTGISVSVAGIIGFVGLVIPHLSRLVVGSDYRILLVSSFLGGGLFLMLSDIVARTIIAPNELPIGVITGMLGGLVFILALSRSIKTKTSN